MSKIRIANEIVDTAFVIVAPVVLFTTALTGAWVSFGVSFVIVLAWLALLIYVQSPKND